MLWLPASVMGQDATAVDQPGVTIHVVQRGENLFRLALRYGLTVDDIARLNGISDPSNIYVGQRLLVPAQGATPVPTPAVVHIVQPGETLDSIAQLYGMTADDLRTLNHIAEAELVVGQMLDVSSSSNTSAAPQMIADASSAVDTTETLVHTVLRGESLFKISKLYGVTVNDIVQANHLSDPELIYPGQELTIPGVEPPQIASVLPAPAVSLTIMPLILVEGRSGQFHLTTSKAVTAAGTFLAQTLHDGVDGAGTHHTLLIGIPVGAKAGVYPLTLTMTDTDGAQTTINANIQVVSGEYSLERIQLPPDRADLLNPAMEDAELATLRRVMRPFTATRYYDGPMGLPAAAPMSSTFGNLRSYNGGAFSRVHTGTDFAAAPGTPIFAAAAGKVVLVDALNVRGNATIIDHGWGVYTVYCHQTEQYVHVGDMVTAGQVIGTTGSTGRVTGAHLHWELWVGDVPVDAMQWVSDSFS
jgi:murein DD-endopeptidase MepM/ murein hydrolase activator NlpD